MSQHYSDPSREDDEHALPDVEVFYLDASDVMNSKQDAGYYYWSCFPGCLPDSDPIGPFATEQEAIEDAQSNND